MLKEPTFTFGIEEEYLLVDRATGELAADPPASLLAECQELLGDQVTLEFIRCQIEVGTRVCASPTEARAELRRLRAGIAEAAGRHGLAPVAAATHPFADWSRQRITDKARYASIADDLQTVGRRLVICGMHVHVEVADQDLRIDLMNQMRYFVPHLLVLSTSSPFWNGMPSGLKSYRLAVYREIPRTGLPGVFGSWHEYQSTLDVLVRNGIIEDASKIWWDLRPSASFPTLELRVADVCTRLEDAIAISQLYRCLVRMLYRLRRDNQRWRQYPLFLLDENRWRAQRYGFDEGLFDFGRGTVVPYAELLEEILALVLPDAEHFGCLPEVEHARRIVAEGTSADRQLAVYGRALAEGASPEQARARVVEHLRAETLEGTRAT